VQEVEASQLALGVLTRMRLYSLLELHKQIPLAGLFRMRYRVVILRLLLAEAQHVLQLVSALRSTRADIPPQPWWVIPLPSRAVISEIS